MTRHMARQLRRLIREKAEALGFDQTGFCDATPGARDSAAYLSWIDAGMGGEMAYMSRPDRVDRALDPRLTLPGARSVVVVALSYAGAAVPPRLLQDRARGLFARYAWGPDYHDQMLPRLEELGAFVSEVTGQPAVERAAEDWRAYVDTGPLLERDAAVRADLGFMGRNTMLIHPRRGSWLFLGEVLVRADLSAESSAEQGISQQSESSADRLPGTCGECTRCLDACPTRAFPEPYVLDSRRCISYLTIELKGPIPRHLRPAVGNRVFGCDICNDVCPYNKRFARATNDPVPLPDLSRAAPVLLELAALDDAGFRDRFLGTPVYRSKRRGLARNVCVALGNWGAPEAVAPLIRALDDPEPLVRGHAAWALGRIGGPDCHAALARAQTSEADPWVIEEIGLANESAS